MDEKQLVNIPLDEYLELLELKKHKKEVKIEEVSIRKDATGKDLLTGTSVYWMSDGACWMSLTEKLDNQGRVVKQLIKEKGDLAETNRVVTERMAFYMNRIDSFKELSKRALYREVNSR
jgi:hypothetical protein